MKKKYRIISFLLTAILCLGAGNSMVYASEEAKTVDVMYVHDTHSHLNEFATVEDGQYLEVRDCAFLHADRATLNINADGSFDSGMYRVGIDIPAGEYKLTAEDDGYWCIYKNSELPLDIINNDLFEKSAYVTVKEGQYLKTSDCIAVPVK